MNSAFAVARSGLAAAGLRLDSAAHNIANAQTPHFRRQLVAQEAVASGGVSATTLRSNEPGAELETEIVGQMSALYTFRANLQSLKAQDRMLGSLLDATA
jgi:flagellar basal body rod protein FlgC